MFGSEVMRLLSGGILVGIPVCLAETLSSWGPGTAPTPPRDTLAWIQLLPAELRLLPAG